MKVGSLCLVAPVDELVRCPVWFSENLEDDEGSIIDVHPGHMCIVLAFDELPNAGNSGSESWVKALFTEGPGWIPEADLEEVLEDEDR